MVKKIDSKIDKSFLRAGMPECYVFNEELDEELDDGLCEHCAKYLTTDCEYIDEFVDEIDELEE